MIDDFTIISNEIISELRAVCREGQYCGYISFAALSNIFGQPIHLMFPLHETRNSPNTKQMSPFNPAMMNTEFTPFRCGVKRFESIYILACGKLEEFLKNQKSWNANHYVLIVDPFATPSPARSLSFSKCVLAAAHDSPSLTSVLKQNPLTSSISSTSLTVSQASICSFVPINRVNKNHIQIDKPDNV